MVGWVLLVELTPGTATEWAVKIGGLLVAVLGVHRQYKKDQTAREERVNERISQQEKETAEIRNELEKVAILRQGCQSIQMDNYKKTARGIGNLTGEIKRTNQEILHRIDRVQTDVNANLAVIRKEVDEKLSGVHKRIDEIYLHAKEK